MLNRDEILKANDCPVTSVDVKEWGGEVYVRQMKIAEMESLNSLPQKDGQIDVAALGVRIILDNDGNRLFADEDADELREKSFKALNTVVGVFNDINGLSDDSIESAGNE